MLFLKCMTLFLQRNTKRWKTRDFELKIVINLVIAIIYKIVLYDMYAVTIITIIKL